MRAQECVRRLLIGLARRLDRRRSYDHDGAGLSTKLPGGATMRNTIDRRRFLLSLGALAATQSLSLAVRAAMGPDDKFDLLIKGGDVLDPSQRLRAVRISGFATG
jgi:hypothetical protein